MFTIQDLTRFSLKRTPLDALWFYVVYAVFGFLIIIAISLVVIPFLNFEAMDTALLSEKLGRSVAIVVSSGLALLIVLAKDLHKNIVYLALILAAAVFAAWGGLYLGLLVPAFLTLVPVGGVISLSVKVEEPPIVKKPIKSEAKPEPRPEPKLEVRTAPRQENSALPLIQVVTPSMLETAPKTPKKKAAADDHIRRSSEVQKQ